MSKEVLIIGGGDGQDYGAIREKLSGDFWELSEAMLDLARVNLKDSNLRFHHGNFSESEVNAYDEIWLHFVVDTLKDEDIESFLDEVKKRLKPSGTVVLVDFFSPSNWRQAVLHSLMLRFFQWTTDHPRKNIPDYESFFQKAGFKIQTEVKFKQGWVRSQRWRISIED